MILLHESRHWRIYVNLCEKYFEHIWTHFFPQESGVIFWIRWRKRNHCCNLELPHFVIEICPLCLWSDLVLSSMTPTYHQVSKKFICCEVAVTSLWLALVTACHLIGELWTQWTPLYSFFFKVRHPWCVLYDQYIYRVSQEEWTKLQESVLYVKLYRYNQKHVYPKLNGYGDNGHRKVWASGVSTYCKPSVTP